jgi:hypothetical protein
MQADYLKQNTIYGFTDRTNHPVFLNLPKVPERASTKKLVGAFSFCKGASSIRADSCSPEMVDSGSIIKKKCAYRPEAGFINSLKKCMECPSPTWRVLSET